MNYGQTLSRVETYFDKTATKTWEALTSDAPVSKVRATVRAGRDRMREVLLSTLPKDLRGARVLDAGCGAGQMTIELAKRGATVVACDISPSLVDIARDRLPEEYQSKVTFIAGDMLSAKLGEFDHVIAMDSLIYYSGADIGKAISTLSPRVSGKIVFTVAPRSTILMGMWYAGKLFPRSDRSPVMIPHAVDQLSADLAAQGVKRPLKAVEKVTSGFYISQALEVCG